MAGDEAAGPDERASLLARAPVPAWLRDYDGSTLRGDLFAALVVTALMVPQSLGYAALAGAPVQAGLYALPVALIAYAALGSSPQLVVGPVSTVSVMTGSFVAARGAEEPAAALALVAALAIISGLFLLAAGALRIGWVAEFLSKPITTGFVFGLSIVIVITEIPTLLGLPRPSGSTLGKLEGIVAGLGDVDTTTAVIGLTSLLVLFVGGRVMPMVPWALLLVVIGLVVSRIADLAGEGVAVVGAVPRGLPSPSVPDLPLTELSALIVSGAALALVGLAETLSASRLFAVRRGYHVEADREFVATGAANVASGFVGGLGVGGSLSKTAASDGAGGRSQMTGLAAAALAVVVLVFFAPSLRSLPRVVLSAVVIHAVWSLMDVRALARYRRIRRNDFVGALVALAGVLVLGPLWGVLVAIAQSVLGLTYRAGQVHVDVMGKVKGEKAAWGSLRPDHDRRTVDGILVLRLGTPLFWLNSASTTTRILDEVEASTGTEVVIIDLEATNQLDTTSADALCELIRVLHRQGVDVYLVRVMRLTRRVLRRTGVLQELGPDHMWRTISQGVRAAKRAREAAS
jgi:high affinity sulfate transporter 1